MKKITSIVLICFCVLSISACNTTRSGISKSSPSLILNGRAISDNELGNYQTWRCRDWGYGGNLETLVEVGFLTNSIVHEEVEVDASLQIGFVLYEGTNIGTIADYKRSGLEHRWDWEENGGKYVFLVKSDGTGYYFDLSVSTDSREAYECSK